MAERELTVGDEQPLHPGAEPLVFLLGLWRGSGTVTFHTLDAAIDFEEQIRFPHRGRPWLVYEQDSWRVDDHTPLHTEMGIWRMVDVDRVNIFVTLTAGCDMSDGTLVGQVISLTSVAAPMADGIETVNKLSRLYRADGDRLDYEIWLGTDQQPYQSHVTATLTRR